MKKIILFFTIFATLISKAQTTTVTATVYNAVVEQCNEDVIHTATMFRLDLNNPYRHKIIAVSRDMEKLGFTMNSKVKVSGAGKYDGVYTIRDRMNKRWFKKIDILINEDMDIGKWNNVLLTIIKN